MDIQRGPYSNLHIIGSSYSTKLICGNVSERNTCRKILSFVFFFFCIRSIKGKFCVLLRRRFLFRAI
jgi:hypothetical protein